MQGTVGSQSVQIAVVCRFIAYRGDTELIDP